MGSFYGKDDGKQRLKGILEDKDFNNFLAISLGSAFEFETQLIICKNLQFINQEDFNLLEAEIQHIQNMIIKLKKTTFLASILFILYLILKVE